MMKQIFLKFYHKYKILCWIILGGIITGSSILLYFYIESYYLFPNLSSKKVSQIKEPSLIFLDINNYPVDYSVKQSKVIINYEDIPKDLIKTLLSVEDPNFFFHKGISLSSLLKNIILLPLFIILKKTPHGGSTITQQLVRNLFLTFKYSYVRKIREIFLALRLERHLKKEEILTMYLNNIYFGNGVYGIGTAAKTFFNKKLSHLNYNEIAYLIGIIKNPNFSSEKYFKQAKIRKNYVLNSMYQSKIITQEVLDYSILEPIKFYKSAGNDKNLIGRYFINYMMGDIKKIINNHNVEGDVYIKTNLHVPTQKIIENISKNYISEINDKIYNWYGTITNISEDQLAIMNNETIAKKINKYYNPAVYGINIMIGVVLDDEKVLLNNNQWVNLENFEQYKHYLIKGSVFLVKQIQDKFFAYQKPQIESSIMITDGLGRVMAATGGNDYSLSSFNRISTILQPSSTIKILILYFLLENGVNLQDIFEDEPLEIILEDGQKWKPRNWDSKFFGPLTVKKSVLLSRNCSVIKAVMSIPDWQKKIKIFFNRLGIYNFKPSYIIGSMDFSIEKLSQLYDSFANGGFKISQLKYMDYIKDDMGLIFENKNNLNKKILNENIINEVLNTFQENNTIGLSASLKIPKDWATKSGTSNNNKRFLFVAIHKPCSKYPHGLVIVTTIAHDQNDSIKSISNRTAGEITKQIINSLENNQIIYPIYMSNKEKKSSLNTNNNNIKNDNNNEDIKVNENKSGSDNDIKNNKENNDNNGNNNLEN